MKASQSPRELRWVLFPPQTIVLTPKQRAGGLEIRNPIVVCAQAGQSSIDAMGAYLAAWACAAEPGSVLEVRCVLATDAQAAELAAADNPPKAFDDEHVEEMRRRERGDDGR